ncbi:hypothetical protein JCM11491_000275 [Sporobolomyces phaffii]
MTKQASRYAQDALASQHSSEIDFAQGPHGMYHGKDANNVYQGYRGQLLNPHSTPEEKIHAHHMMAVFENAVKSQAQGYRGTIHDPHASLEAKAYAAEKLEGLPSWGDE